MSVVASLDVPNSIGHDTTNADTKSEAAERGPIH